MRKDATTIAILLLSGLVPLAGATHDTGACTPHARDAVAAGPVYIDDRGNGDVWLYLESNEVEGLQAGGESITGLYTDHVFTENCGHGPDTLVF